MDEERKLILKFDKEMKRINEGHNPLRRAIMGFYGESVVASEFERKRFNVKREGNLTGYDLSVNGKKIEVRTSELKTERAFPDRSGRPEVKAWGWKLQTRDRNKKLRPIQ